MARLPQPGGDQGTWGAVLNEFLQVSHNPDGTLKNFFINVKDFGAKGDGVSDDTASIQAALNSINGTYSGAARGGIVFFPAGAYKTTAPLTVKNFTKLYGAGNGSTIIMNSVSTVFTIHMSLVSLEGFMIRASGGHVFDIQGSFIEIRRCHLQQFSDSYSVIVTDLMINCLFETITVDHTKTATVPTFLLKASGNGINANVFRNIRFTNSGNYSIWMESTSGDGYCQDNIFEEMTFEITTGGAMKLLSCFNIVMRQCVVWDFPATEAKRDMFYVGKSPGALPSSYIKFEQCGRRFGGYLPNGFVDIRLESGGAARLIVIEQCDVVTLGTYFTIDAGANSFVELRGLTNNITVTNYNATALRTQTVSGIPTYAAPDGTIAVDPINSKIYVRVGGIWKSAALT